MLEKHLIVSARRAEAAIEMEFVVVTTEGGNLEDKLAYMNGTALKFKTSARSPSASLRHYASSVRHHKYHDTDIITVQVAPSS